MAAGSYHSLLLKCDGTVAACGSNGSGQCNIPALDENLTNTQVAAGSYHSLLLKSDGTVPACGSNDKGQCNIPSLKTWTEWFSGSSSQEKYVAAQASNKRGSPLLLQAAFEGNVITLFRLNGETECELVFDAQDYFTDVQMRMASALRLAQNNFDVIFPSGQQLSNLVQAQPLARIDSLVKFDR